MLYLELPNLQVIQHTQKSVRSDDRLPGFKPCQEGDCHAGQAIITHALSLFNLVAGLGTILYIP